MRLRLVSLILIAVLVAACDTKSPTAPSALTISTQPQSTTISSGETATLSVASTGTGTLRYQWYVGASGTTSAPIPAATSETYTTPPLTTSTSYWVRVADENRSADSATATITVTPPAAGPPPPAPGSPVVAPTIVEQPENQTISSGKTATLTVEATGTAPFEYRWYVGDSGTTSSPVAGVTSASFTTPALTTTTRYWVRVSNTAGRADSTTATITVTVPPPPPPPGVAPTISAHPQSQTVTAGQTAMLVVTANGTPPLSYQWYVGQSGTTSMPIAGATAASMTTAALTATTSYWVRVSNAHGTADSTTATMTVAPDLSGAPFEDQVLTLINQRRAAGATCGGTSYPPVGPLYMNANLRAAARGHSLDMAVQNYFSHTSLDGRTFDQRIRDAGYTGAFPLGENIAAGQPTPQIVVDGWMASPGHCTNIMTGSFRATGIGYAFRAGSTYGHYWVQTLGGS